MNFPTLLVPHWPRSKKKGRAASVTTPGGDGGCAWTRGAGGGGDPKGWEDLPVMI